MLYKINYYYYCYGPTSVVAVVASVAGKTLGRRLQISDVAECTDRTWMLMAGRRVDQTIVADWTVDWTDHPVAGGRLH